MEPQQIRDDFLLSPSDVEFIFTRASGAGGQYVNRTDSAVQLRFSLDKLPQDIRSRVQGNISGDGFLLVDAQEHRSQLQNKEEAYRRLTEILRRASIVPKTRRQTKPTRASRIKRLQTKRLHSEKKKLRKCNSRDME